MCAAERINKLRATGKANNLAILFKIFMGKLLLLQLHAGRNSFVQLESMLHFKKKMFIIDICIEFLYISK